MRKFCLPILSSCLLLIGLSQAGCALHSLREPARELFSQRALAAPLASAHRGDTRTASGNSREALESAVREGIPLIETDLRLSADGKLFHFHDKTFHPDNSAGPAELFGKHVETLTSEELKQFKQLSGGGLLDFATGLAIVRGKKSILQIDPKGDGIKVIDSVIRAAEDTGQEGQLVIQCYDLSTLAYVRRNHPHIAVLARANSVDEVPAMLKFSPEIVQVDEAWLTPKLVHQIHSALAEILVKASDGSTDNLSHWCALFEHGGDILLSDKAIELRQKSQNCRRS